MGYRQRLRQFGRLLLRQHSSPGRVALAIVVGCAVGCTPLFGLHLALCALLSLGLRLNLPITYGAANISIPPLVPFIGWGAVQLGEYLRHGRFLALRARDFTPAALPELARRFFVAWLGGGVLLGAGIGLVVGGLVYALLRWRRGRAQAADDADDAEAAAADVAIGRALEAAGRRFAATPPRYRYYALSKYHLDPCYRVLCQAIPPGAEVVDLGCGLGMLAVALAELGGGRRVLGVDWDADKVAAGRRAAAGLDAVRLEVADLRQLDLPACDVVTLVDVLHYYDAPGQAAVLRRAAAALRPGGRLLIRETDPARAGGARLTRLFERWMVRLGWNRGPRVLYRPLAALRLDLEALGLTTTQAELAAATHPGNVLITALRPAEPAPGSAFPN